MRIAVLLLAAVALAGCADAMQQEAENAVSARAPGTKVSCTRNARVGYVNPIPTKTFICIAKRGAADCDRWVVTVSDERFVPRLDKRRADCLLPPS